MTPWVRLLYSLSFLRKKQRNIHSLTFSSVEKEAKRHPPNPSPSLYGRGVTDSGGMPPCVRVLVWLTKPLPLRGEPWIFVGWRIEKSFIIYYHAKTPRGLGAEPPKYFLLWENLFHILSMTGINYCDGITINAVCKVPFAGIGHQRKYGLSPRQ